MSFMSSGEYLKNKRCEKGISQRELARMLDMSNTHISNLEKSAIGNPAYGHIRKLAKVLDFDVKEYYNLHGVHGAMTPIDPHDDEEEAIDLPHLIATGRLKYNDRILTSKDKENILTLLSIYFRDE